MYGLVAPRLLPHITWREKKTFAQCLAGTPAIFIDDASIWVSSFLLPLRRKPWEHVSPQPLAYPLSCVPALFAFFFFLFPGKQASPFYLYCAGSIFFILLARNKIQDIRIKMQK